MFAIPPIDLPSPCTEPPPDLPNGFSDGGVINPVYNEFQFGGAGMWWPERDILSALAPYRFFLTKAEPHRRKGLGFLMESKWLRFPLLAKRFHGTLRHYSSINPDGKLPWHGVLAIDKPPVRVLSSRVPL